VVIKHEHIIAKGNAKLPTEVTNYDPPSTTFYKKNSTLKNVLEIQKQSDVLGVICTENHHHNKTGSVRTTQHAGAFM
jgi:hypothetical protein